MYDPARDTYTVSDEQEDRDHSAEHAQHWPGQRNAPDEAQVTAPEKPQNEERVTIANHRDDHITALDSPVSSLAPLS